MNGCLVLGHPDVCEQSGVGNLINNALTVKEHSVFVNYSSIFLLHEDVLALVDVIFFRPCIFFNIHMRLLLLLLIGSLPCYGPGLEAYLL